MRQTIKYVVMSKKVAQAYLDRVGEVTSTITVYASDDAALEAFMGRVSSDYQSVTASRGFDYATFLTEDRDVAQAIVERARRAGLTPSGF